MQAPKRHRPQLVSRVLRPNLYDSITGSHVVQQKIAVRMDNFIA